MNRTAFIGLLAALAVSSPVQPEAVDAELEATIDRLQSAYDRLETLEAQFVQSLESLALGEPQVESGVVYLQRPARMRWEYQEPEEKLAVVDGQDTWLYIPAENQVYVGSLSALERGGATSLLLAGRVDLRRDFLIRKGEGSDPLSLMLFPRVPNEEFERLDLILSPETGLPARIRVQGALGDVMEYRFAGIRTGVPLDAGLFRFDPPDGVELVPAP